MIPEKLNQIKGTDLLYPLYPLYRESSIVQNHSLVPDIDRVLGILDMYVSQKHWQTGELTVKSKILSNLLRASDRNIGFVLDNKKSYVDFALIPVGEKDYLIVTIQRPRPSETVAIPNSFLLLGENPVNLTIDEGQIKLHHGYGIPGKMNERVGSTIAMYDPDYLQYETVVNDPTHGTRVRRSVLWQKERCEMDFNAELNRTGTSKPAHLSINRHILSDINVFTKQRYTTTSGSINMNDLGTSISVRGTAYNNGLHVNVDGRKLVRIFLHDGLKVNFNQVPQPEKNIAEFLDNPEVVLPTLANKLHRAAEQSSVVVWSP